MRFSQILYLLTFTGDITDIITTLCLEEVSTDNVTNIKPMCRISESSDGNNDNKNNDNDKSDDTMSLPPPPPPADELDDVYIDIEEDDEVYKNGRYSNPLRDDSTTRPLISSDSMLYLLKMQFR